MEFSVLHSQFFHFLLSGTLLMKHLIFSFFTVLLFLSSPVFAAESDAAASPEFSPIPAFSYDGTPVVMDVKSESGTPQDAFTPWVKTFTTKDGKLQVRFDGRTYRNFPVTEYTVRLTNLSESEPTGLISGLQTFSAACAFSPAGSVRVEGFAGSLCTAEDFTPFSHEIKEGETREYVNPGGRSSEQFMPFLELNFSETEGMLFAPRWTGRWRMTFTNENADHIGVQLGMFRTNFRLLPGETILQPGVTVFRRSGVSRNEFQTLVHRFMLEHKVPRDSHGDVIPPILAVACGGGNKTPEMMQAILKYVVENGFPFDTYWIDAGWYGPAHEDEHFENCGPNWWKYRGDWRVNTATHPTGTLLPIADAVHNAGMKLLVWFEPECVSDGMAIREEHPEFCTGQLLNYGNPDALRWIQNEVYSFIEKHGVNVYRQDFNTDPAASWDALDADPERVGIAEARHIEGLYRFLDDMKARFPDILQENCASGGRRMDVEMISRAHSYCRSDYYIGQKPGDSAINLGQTATRNIIAYVPFQGCEFNCVPVGDDYAAFSIISSGTVITFSDFDRGIVGRDFSAEETSWFQKIFTAADRMKPYFSGDFYPLTEESSPKNDLWCGWQFHRNDMNSGFALIFRRSEAPDDTRTLALKGLNPEEMYRVETYGEEAPRLLSGRELAAWSVTLPPRGFRLIFYKLAH